MPLQQYYQIYEFLPPHPTQLRQMVVQGMRPEKGTTATSQCQSELPQERTAIRTTTTSTHTRRNDSRVRPPHGDRRRRGSRHTRREDHVPQDVVGTETMRVEKMTLCKRCKPSPKAEPTVVSYVCCCHAEAVRKLRREGSKLTTNAADIIDALSRSLIAATDQAGQPLAEGPQR